MADIHSTSTGYPANLDTATTLVNDTVPGDGSGTGVNATHQNGPAGAIIAIETELGTDPAGSATDLKTRLAVSMNDSGTLKLGTAGAIGANLLASKGGTGLDTSASTGFARVTTGTWSVSALVAADLPTLAFNRVTRTAGNLSTTSTSLVDLTGATVTFTTGAFPVVMGLSAEGWHGTADAEIHINCVVDSTLLLGTTGRIFHADTANININASTTCMTAALTAASHTVKVQWSTNTGTANIGSDSAQSLHFWANEIR